MAERLTEAEIEAALDEGEAADYLGWGGVVTAALRQVREERDAARMALFSLLDCLEWYSEQHVVDTTADWLWDNEYTEAHALPAYRAARATLAASEKEPK